MFPLSFFGIHGVMFYSIWKHRKSRGHKPAAFLQEHFPNILARCLELGIDIGTIDLVVQVETPPSVASGLQRVGRAGHQVGAVSRGMLCTGP